MNSAHNSNSNSPIDRLLVRFGCQLQALKRQDKLALRMVLAYYTYAIETNADITVGASAWQVFDSNFLGLPEYFMEAVGTLAGLEKDDAEGLIAALSALICDRH